MKRIIFTLSLTLLGSAAFAQVIPQPSGPVPIGCAYNTSPAALTDGQAGWAQCDTTGALKTAPVASALGGYSFSNIAAGQATTTVKSSAGVLHAIIFNGPATATSTMVVYDNTAASGTVIGRPLATAVVSPVTIQYDLQFATGLTIITAVANGADMTVVYK